MTTWQPPRRRGRDRIKTFSTADTPVVGRQRGHQHRIAGGPGRVDVGDCWWTPSSVNNQPYVRRDGCGGCAAPDGHLPSPDPQSFTVVSRSPAVGAALKTS